jgi:glutamyl-Q tRNA(Asp) synthetase
MTNASLHPSQPYVGRFAPSPTGPLHFGSLVAALASYLDARANNGLWLLRIEDLDPQRESPAAPSEILSQLETFGFHWDGELLYQSARLDAYEEALNRLNNADLIFPCTCSRKSIQGVYPGHCRDRKRTDEPSASRMLTDNRTIDYNDLILGHQSSNLERDTGDFIVKRKDGLFAYQLAVVVDDAYQGVTHIVRGSDLLDSTSRQIYLAENLGFQSMQYGHFPIILGSDGHKLSKQSHAASVSTTDPPAVINLALRALGQSTVVPASAEKMLQQATTQWSLDNVPKQLDISDRQLHLP